jgi:hypothetical protein
MLDAYLTDIAQLLAEQRWQEAESAALALPNIAVFLSERDGRSSLERYRDWCRLWVAEQESDGTYDAWYARATSNGNSLEEGIPRRALRSLRLHRLMRIGSIVVGQRVTDGLETQGMTASRLCRALIRATSNWYSRYALRSEGVQRKLSKLAVLR